MNELTSLQVAQRGLAIMNAIQSRAAKVNALMQNLTARMNTDHEADARKKLLEEVEQLEILLL